MVAMRAVMSLLLVACTAAPRESEPAPEPAPAAEVPRRVADRTAPPAPPRVLHPRVHDFAARAGGDLVVVLDGDEGRALYVLDPETGKTTPWPQPWRAAEAGWRLRPHGEWVERVVASADGQWFAVVIEFITRDDDRFSAVVVVRADGGEPRCVGVDSFAAEPMFTRERLLVGLWTYGCAPDRRGREVAVSDGGDRHQLRWYDPRAQRRGVRSRSIYALGWKDPLGDMLIEQEAGELRFVDLATDATVGAAKLPGPVVRQLGWMFPDAVYVAHGDGDGDDRPLARAVVFADGRVVARPEQFEILTRLPNGALLFREDGGPIAQGRFDRETLEVVSSFPRHDLASYIHAPMSSLLGEHARRTWTPALGGVLIAERPRGRLAFAGL